MASEWSRLSLCPRIDQRLLTSSPTAKYRSSNDKKRVVAPPWAL
jgi:hypothetical protein